MCIRDRYEDIIYCEGQKGDVYVEVAFQHNDSYNDSCFSFVNNITTPEGGTHLAGFKNAMTKTFNEYARNQKLLKDNDANLSGDDIREGLTAIISIKIPEPQFEGQTCLLYTSILPSQSLLISNLKTDIHNSIH